MTDFTMRTVSLSGIDGVLYFEAPTFHDADAFFHKITEAMFPPRSYTEVSRYGRHRRLGQGITAYRADKPTRRSWPTVEPEATDTPWMSNPAPSDVEGCTMLCEIGSPRGIA